MTNNHLNSKSIKAKLSVGVIVIFVLQFAAGVAASHASNPIESTQYSADPSGHVFGDRLYVYASHDRNDAKTFDMVDYHVYSTDDMQNWRDHGVVLRVSDVKWASGSFWAPDCGYKNGKYYLYFPAKDKSGTFHVGVAIGKTPIGPFADIGHPIAGVDGIDPSIFIDDSGAPYLIWATKGAALLAKLKPNMTELAEAPHRLEVTDFFEGPWLFKRNGKYYFTYPGFKINGVYRGGHGQNYDYAIASNIYGPYESKGPFTQSGPGGDNIHGSQLEWHDKWYCFYHDFSTSVGTQRQGVRRNVRVDEMTFAGDGSINQLVWTSDGPAQLHPLDPYAVIDAGTMNKTDQPESEHPIAVNTVGQDSVVLGPMLTGSWIRYSKADFGAGAKTFQAEVASATGGGTIEVRSDAIDGPLLGTCTAPYTGGWSEFTTVECPVASTSGIHDFVLVFKGRSGSNLFTLRSLHFTK